MGHVEPGGEAAAAELTVEAAYWPVWRRLTRMFATWSFVATGLATPGAWTTFGNDLVSGLRANASTRKAFAATAGLSDEDVERLYAVALLNQRRHDWVMRILVIFYVTIPVTIVALLSEILGDGLLQLVRENPGPVANLVIILAVGVAIYLMAQWRARQIVCVIELIRISRGLTDR
ncbi:hypothetical protein [Brevundimonas balnearis]|uniref:Uncharacterized protein n=1 Tax=Brevundimonas balnearis TaxID=1572858 RepID=A0ABV6R270_9CAUL